QGFSGSPIPNDWVTNPDRILFSASTGDSTNLWQVEIATTTSLVTHAPQRLTSGTGRERQPSGAIGATRRFVFSSIVENISIWGLPIDAGQGKPTGEIGRLTEASGSDIYPSLSADGRRMIFVSNRSGEWQLWLKNFELGKETNLAIKVEGAVRSVAISPDGS